MESGKGRKRRSFVFSLSFATTHGFDIKRDEMFIPVRFPVSTTIKSPSTLQEMKAATPGSLPVHGSISQDRLLHCY